jgi:hypothetical protein
MLLEGVENFGNQDNDFEWRIKDSTDYDSRINFLFSLSLDGVGYHGGQRLVLQRFVFGHLLRC